MKARFLAIVFFVSLTSLFSFADTNHLAAGSYASRDGFIGDFRLKDWGASSLLEGVVKYGDVRLPFQAVLDFAGNGLFSGEGTLNVAYGEVRCAYRALFEVRAGEAGLYVRHHAPVGFPSQSVGCPRVQNTWLVSPNPYVRARN